MTFKLLEKYDTAFLTIFWHFIHWIIHEWLISNRNSHTFQPYLNINLLKYLVIVIGSKVCHDYNFLNVIFLSLYKLHICASKCYSGKDKGLINCSRISLAFPDVLLAQLLIEKINCWAHLLRQWKIIYVHWVLIFCAWINADISSADCLDTQCLHCQSISWFFYNRNKLYSMVESDWLSRISPLRLEKPSIMWSVSKTTT